jgi:hypothetical protein
MTCLALSWCALGALNAVVVRRVAVRAGRDSLAWPVLGFCVGPLVLLVLIALKPLGATRREVRPRVLWLVALILVVGGAAGVTAAFVKLLKPRPDRVVATALVNGAWVPTEPDGPTSFAIAMLVGGATLVVGVAVGGIGGLMLTPPVAFAIERLLQSANETCRSSSESAPRRLGGVGHQSLRVALGLFCGLVLLVAAWLCVFGMPLSGVFVSLAALQPILCHRRTVLVRRARPVLILALTLAACIFWKTPVQELASTLQRLRETKDQRGPTGFSTTDKLGIYGLNIVMGLGGLIAGFPEVAQETLCLTVEGPSTRTWHSDFAMRSPKVRAGVRQLAAVAEAHGDDENPLTLPTMHIAWSAYSMKLDSARVALALNSPFELGGTAHREGAGWRLELVGRAKAEYPRRSVHHLFSLDGKSIELDEGLFWVLQESGWLHPYFAEWRWSVLSKDPRLENLETPFLSLGERFLGWILQR